MKLHTTQETKKIDALAIRETKHTGYSLMRSAAEFSLDILISEFHHEWSSEVKPIYNKHYL